MKRPIILASSSPRRQYLLKAVGFEFTVEKPIVDEDWPRELPVDQVARYLAEKKAESFRLSLSHEIVVTSDTVVIIGNEILNKPASRNEAIQMLERLSGKTHLVMTGYCILSDEREVAADESTYVTFRKLTRWQIEQYIDTYEPYDKAGSYGAQDCLEPDRNPCSTEEINFLASIEKTGLIAQTVTPAPENHVVIIDKLEGSYFNVMGFPIHKVYPIIKSFEG